MATKLKFDTVRYCLNNRMRMGKWMGEDIATLISEEVAGIKEQQQYLISIIRPLANWWTDRKAQISYLVYDSEMIIFDGDEKATLTAGTLDEIVDLVKEIDSGNF